MFLTPDLRGCDCGVGGGVFCGGVAEGALFWYTCGVGGQVKGEEIWQNES